MMFDDAPIAIINPQHNLPKIFVFYNLSFLVIFREEEEVESVLEFLPEVM